MHLLFARCWIKCLGGGIGRRKGLKIPRGLSLYEFDSRPRHQYKKGFYENNVRKNLFYISWFVTTQRRDKMKKLFFGLSLILLLAAGVSAADDDTVTVDVLTKTGSSWDQSVLPDYPKGKPEITILRIKIPSGVLLPLHKHPVINAGVLLNGELTVMTKDNKTLHLKAGDPIVEVVNKWHYGKNEGTEPAEIIVFYAGTQDMSITIKK